MIGSLLLIGIVQVYWHTYLVSLWDFLKEDISRKGWINDDGL